MYHVSRVLIVLTAAVCLAGCFAADATAAEEGWQDLFNGKDLTGWKPIGGDKAAWGAKDGLLYTTGTGGGWLSTTKQYADFEIDLDFRVPENGNSGIFIRTPQRGNPAAEGLEVQVLDDYGDKYKTLKPNQYCGSVYFVKAPAKRVSRPAGEWQTMRVRAVGPHIAVWLNGVPISETDISKAKSSAESHPGMTRTQGYIGFQNHGSRLDYRNIRIREFKPAEK